MTKTQLSELFGISRPTLNKWEKEKPELVRLVNQGLLIDDLIKEAEENLKKLKDLKEGIESNKFNLK